MFTWGVQAFHVIQNLRAVTICYTATAEQRQVLVDVRLDRSA